MKEFSHLFRASARKNMSDGHLWFSVVARPPASRFTRVQRVCCCLCLLYTTMLANALFYRVVAPAEGAKAVSLGPFAMSMEQVRISAVTNFFARAPKTSTIQLQRFLKKQIVNKFNIWKTSVRSMSALHFILNCVNFLCRMQWTSNEMYKKPESECPLYVCLLLPREYCY